MRLLRRAQHRADIDTIRAIACIPQVSFYVVGAGPYVVLRLPSDHWLTILNQTFIYVRIPFLASFRGSFSWM